ncbi:MAG: divalent-cation tolerance protein CutA [Candidatus Woesearchaeota archaeon]
MKSKFFKKQNKLMTKCLVVITTTNKMENAEKIATILLKNRLVACAQILSIKSFYWWENNIQKDKEFLLFLKTKSENYKVVEKKIIENHNYKLPEIIALEASKGSRDYFEWIERTLNRKNKNKNLK